MPDFPSAIRHLLQSTPAAASPTDLDSWQRHYTRVAAHWPEPAVRALVTGFEAPCIAFAFAGGYQAALARMLGTSGSGFAALCVTEQDGNRPRHIATRLRATAAGWALDGEKSYVTGGTHAETLYVAARTDQAGAARAEIRMLRIPAARAGVRIHRLPDTPFVPELPHACVSLENVTVAADEVLPGDGYARYVKPFRTIEDCHVELALVGQMWRRTRALPDTDTLLERLAAQAATLSALCALAPEDPSVHLALAGSRNGLMSLLQDLEPVWERGDPDFHATWLRDRKLLLVAATAREARTAQAWQELLPGSHSARAPTATPDPTLPHRRAE